MEPPAVILLAGLPGAGKTTLIDRAAPGSRWTVVDTDRLRRRLPRALRLTPVLYALHVAAMIAAIARRPRVVVHSRGTSRVIRRLVTALARARGRDAVLVLLDAPPLAAHSGQLRRGRVVRREVMAREVARWPELRRAAQDGGLAGEGWTAVVLLTRPQAGALGELDALLPACSGAATPTRPVPPLLPAG